MQRRIRDKHATRDAKLEVLLMQWDRIVKMLAKKNKHPKHRGNKLGNFLDAIAMIDPDVKKAAMAQYLHRVKLKHYVAFSQWRY